MKNYISEDQLKSLSPEQMEKLREWWTPTNFDVFLTKDHEPMTIDGVDEEYGYSFDEKKKEFTSMSLWNQEFKTQKAYPLLSIGQMIEFLSVHLSWYRSPIISRSFEENYEGDMRADVWGVDIDSRCYDAVELCDALWEAVKEVLAKKVK